LSIGCGNTIANGGVLAPDGLVGCNMLCNGNHSEFCGGSSRIDVYDYNDSVNLPPWTSTSGVVPPATSTAPPSTVGTSVAPTTSLAAPSQKLAVKPGVGNYIFRGCYTEATNGRALSAASFFDYTAMTLEECASDCAAYKYFGVEYGGECWSTLQFLISLIFINLCH
jgi:hypothetical protein